MVTKYREAGPEDLPACVHLFLESRDDMLLRHNHPSPPVSPAGRMHAFYQHVLATGIFHLAEAEGQIVAFACANLRDQLWFLSGFWTQPGMQQQHIGMPVLRRVWNAGKQAGAKHFFVWSSVDLPAMAAYMKLGMLPGCQILKFEGRPSLLGAPHRDYAVQPLAKSFAMDLDQTILGTRRETDHDYLSRTGSQGRQVLLGGEAVGYYYVYEGIVGPAAWKEPRHAETLLILACGEASASTQGVVLRVPGMNHTALRFAIQSGLRLTGFSHLLMSDSFGLLEQYLPSGPAIF
jgi:hypothetical protein